MTAKAAGPVEAGWAELERGSWEEAARRFDDALAEGHDGARVFEGRAWAAWWLSDADTLFTMRERAYHAFRGSGDLSSAARAAIWLGCDHHDFRGEHAIANGWYQRARRLLQDLPVTTEHGWLAFQEGAYAIELGDDTETAKARAAEVMEVGRALTPSDLVFLGLALRGLALVTEGAVEEGMRCLDEAGVAATSGEVHERIATTWTLCYLIYACERVRDFDRTAQWCKRMEEAASKVGGQLALGVCRAHYGGVLTFHGKWDRAEHELEQAGITLAAARPPVVGESDARLGELRRRQGRADEAAELFARAIPHPLAVLGLASLALESGDTAEAVQLLEDLVGATPPRSVTQLADAFELLAVAHARLGDIDKAREAAASLDEVAAVIGNRPLTAMAAAANGAVALATGDNARARRCYETAADLFDRGGLPYESATARAELAVALGRLGRADDAANHASAAAGQLRALGATIAADRVEPRQLAATESPVANGSVPGLTRRETEILARLAEGLTDREIAERLVISAHTVHRHVSNILTKLGVPSRAAAAAHWARHGIGT